MPYFTVVQPKRVLRLQAKSVQAVTAALRETSQRWLAIHEDLDDKLEGLAKKFNG